LLNQITPSGKTALGPSVLVSSVVAANEGGPGT